MKNEKPKTTTLAPRRVLATLALWPLCAFMLSCGPGAGRQAAPAELCTNPVYENIRNSTVTFHEGNYYFINGADGVIYLRASSDPVELMRAQRHGICNFHDDYGLGHVWRPMIVNIDGAWYLYLSADDTGNIDNHHIYVFRNSSENPIHGRFEMAGRIKTDPEDNWAIHPCLFTRDGELYMVWSGWETKRLFAETQCLFIAKMENPWTLASERVLISKPAHEWECQWVNADGSTPIAYPLFVNESPAYLCDERADRAYIYYSASALWTPYTAIGELSAPKDADMLDPASWSKNPSPVMSQDRGNGIYGPGSPCVIPSPDGTERYLLYTAKDVEIAPRNRDPRDVYMKKIEIGPDGVPVLGPPATYGSPLAKPSGLRKSTLN